MSSSNDPIPSNAPQTPPTPSSNLSSTDETYYTWSTFFSILIGRTPPNSPAYKSYFRTRDTLHEASDVSRVQSHVRSLFASSPIIRFLRDESRALGHEITAEDILCRRCERSQSGGFDMDYGILLCANHMRDRGHTEDTLAHEMVHAYDHLRFKVDRWNLKHQACTEIRASTLSGECRFMREFFTRRQWKVTQQLQECVRRRATLSLMGRPECKDDVHAAKIVNEVWESCFNDTRPFDEIYR